MPTKKRNSKRLSWEYESTIKQWFCWLAKRAMKSPEDYSTDVGWSSKFKCKRYHHVSPDSKGYSQRCCLESPPSERSGLLLPEDFTLLGNDLGLCTVCQSRLPSSLQRTLKNTWADGGTCTLRLGEIKEQKNQYIHRHRMNQIWEEFINYHKKKDLLRKKPIHPIIFIYQYIRSQPAGRNYHQSPWSCMAAATLTKPAILLPATNEG